MTSLGLDWYLNEVFSIFFWDLGIKIWTQKVDTKQRIIFNLFFQSKEEEKEKPSPKWDSHLQLLKPYIIALLQEPAPLPIV